MVFHAPGKEPFGNRECLGPLRIFTSDQRSAQLLRIPLRLALKGGVSALVVSCCARMLSNCSFANATAVARAIQPLQSTKVVAAGLFIAAIVSSINVKKWRTKVAWQAPLSSDFFHETDAEGNAPPGAAGVLFHAPTRRWHVWPPPSLEHVMRRAFNYTGMSLPAFLRLEFTVGIEYPLQAMWRQVLHYCGSARYTERKDRHQLYLGVINTSFACFICADPDDSDFGNVVMTDLRAPCEAGIVALRRVVFVLDHGRQVLVRVECDVQDVEDGPIRREVWGASILSDNTSPQYDEATQVEQAGQIMAFIIAWLHATVHWWANGTALVDESVWPAAKASTELTNWMNTQSLDISWKFIGYDENDIAWATLQNVAQGLPLHGHHGKSSLMLEVGKRSRFHQMSRLARRALEDHLRDKLPANTLAHNLRTIDAIMAATVWHNADHYYLDRYFPLYRDGQLIMLKTDATGLFRSLAGHVEYNCCAVLLKRFDDPVSQLIYRACARVDQEFADSALCVGCAF